MGLWLVLAVVAITAPRGITYDEPFHLAGAELLVSGGSILDLLRAPLPSAPGPFFPVLHALLHPITGFNAHALRAISLAFAALAAFGIFRTLTLLGNRRARVLGMMLLAIPMVWPAAGLALTEMPAIAMMTVATWMATKVAVFPTMPTRTAIGYAVAAGVFFALAVLGRQLYLAVIVVPVAAAAVDARLRAPVAVFLPIAVAPAAAVFAVWGGLVPPAQQHLTSSGGNPKNLLMASAYAGVCLLILAPQWFRPVAGRRAAAAALLAAVANVAILRFRFAPLLSLARHAPEFVADVYPLVGGTVMIVSFVLVVFTGTVHLLDHRRNPTVAVPVLAMALMIASTFAIAKFSSRYVVTTLPFLSLTAASFATPGRAALWRYLAGGLLGACSLLAYLYG